MKLANNTSVQKYGFGVRHIQLLCMWFAILTLFIARGSLGVAILAMTDEKRKNDTNIETRQDAKMDVNVINLGTNKNDYDKNVKKILSNIFFGSFTLPAYNKIYEWDKKTQGLVLSSFFWGYAVMQIPAGLLSKRYGGKPIFLISLLANGIVCGLLPTLVKYGGWQIACACRVVMGLSQACLYPAGHTLLGKWLPEQERTFYTSIVYAGAQLGLVIAMPVSGILAETKLGWKMIFYSVSCIMMISTALWIFFSANSPKEHRLTTESEREYIERGLNSTANRKLKTPWKEMFRSKGLWATMTTHAGSTVCYMLFFNDMPTYLEKALGISLKNSAFLSALPYLGMILGNIGSAGVCEKIYNKGYLSLSTCRKLFNSIGFVGVSIGVITLAFCTPEQKSIAIVSLIATLTLNGFAAAGFIMSPLDMSPNYAGVMFAISNFVANIGSVLTPIVTSLILNNDPTDLTRWRIVFFLAAGLCITTSVAYVLFSTADRQEWDDPDYLDKRKSDPEEVNPSLNQDKTAEK